MKRTLLFSALVFATHGAFAADATPKANPAADVHADVHTDVHADAHAAAAARIDPASAAKMAAAREELTELRTQMQALSGRMADLSTQLGDVGPRAYAYRYIGQPDRAMIGVVLASDKDGARISAVTPDGPAARAGLHDGDVITAIDQHPIAAATAAASLASARERLANLKENQSVSIGYRRGVQKGVVTIAAQRREAWNWPALMNEDPEHPFLPKDFNERIRADVQRATQEAQRVHVDQDRIRAEVARAHSEVARANSEEMREAAEQARRVFRRGMPWWGINLAPVDAGLGRYFGASSGALVLSTDTASLPGLRAGDVITRVADETVTRPEDVMRALRDQPPGKEIAVKLMRDRKVLALNVKAPEFKSIFSMPPMPPTPPMPATPPMPPTPATPPSPEAAPTPPSPPSAPVTVPVAVQATAAIPATAAVPATATVPAVQTSDDD
jgi:C-terminal processing protease CtpA/Prc